MKIVLIISTFIAVSSRGIHSFTIDEHDNVLASATMSHQLDSGGHLCVDLHSIDSIMPNAFFNLTLGELTIEYHGEQTKKLQNLQPDIFNETSTRKLTVTNVYFPVRPNPFVNLKSVETLQLSDNDFNSFPIDFFADFPDLTDFQWKQYDACQTISPILFSKMNKELKVLVMEDKIIVIEPAAFARLKSLEKLVLHAEKLDRLRPDMFSGLLSLQHLDLSSCGIRDIEPNTFSGLPLTELNLERNFLEYIPLEFGDGLAVLKLNDNQIKNIWNPIYKKYSPAGSLDLSNNQITTISSHVFDRLYLKSLNLRNNSLQVLRKSTFQGLLGIVTLDLGFNKLRDISNQSFCDFIDLTNLHLDHNELRVIKDGTFQDVGPMDILDLSDNEIDHLQPGLFNKFIKSLNLRNNSLRVLQWNTFHGLVGTETLNLGYNSLEDIFAEVYRDMADVKELYLDHNEIGVIRDRTFQGFDDLRLLDLQYNKISRIESRAFTGSSIRSLDLTNNWLTVLGYDAFRGMELPETINLSRNMLSEISSDAFLSIKGVKDLFLNDNQIKVIDAGTFAHFDRLEYLGLSNNQIKHIESGAFTGSRIDRLDLGYNLLEDLQRDTFKCVKIRFNLDLASNRFREIPRELSRAPEVVEHLSLNSNRIKVIRAGTFENFSGISVELANNQIFHIEKGSFSFSNMIQVDLSNNPLDYISKLDDAQYTAPDF